MSTAGPELDAAIAREVFGLEVLGIAPCSYEPECDELEVGRQYGGETVDRPVIHQGECRCAEIQFGKRELFGHSVYSLRPVPEYSADDADSLPIIDRMAELGYWVRVESPWAPGNSWRVVFVKHGFLQEWEPVYLARNTVMATAICIAALAVVRARREGESDGAS